jgi:hypothetical protein
MRIAVMSVFAMLAAVPAAPQEPTLQPCGVPYECAVDIRVANATATWRMTFDHRWPGVYDIVHWDIRYTDGRRSEYLAQLVRPQMAKMHYRFFVRERRGVWWTLGIWKRWVWRQVARPSAENETMVTRVQLLYSISHSLRHEANPTTLRF